MELGRLIHSDSGSPIVAQVHRTNRAWERLRGLIGRAPLVADEGLLIVPCNSVHTFFMRYPIDVVYLDRDLRVLRIVGSLVPRRISFSRRASATLELAPGGALRAGIEVGFQLRWEIKGHNMV